MFKIRNFESLKGPNPTALLRTRTPLLPRGRLGELGYSIVAYPLSLLGVSIKAMQSALDELAEDRIPDSIPTLGEIRDVVEWPQYDALAAKYSSSED